MKYDVVIIGAGIVGLSVAYNIIKTQSNLKIAIIEKESDVAKHQTGNNSGVIHSGIYYKPDSAKAMNCQRGYELLIDFCKAENIDYEICGKIIVATNSDEEEKLQDIYKRGLKNNLKGLKILSKEELLEKEPHVNGIKGIFVPQAGIVNYKQVARKLYEKCKTFGVQFLFNEKVCGINNKEKTYQIITKTSKIKSDFIINCAGLYCDKIAKMSGVDLKARIIPFRGEYFFLRKDRSYLVKNLIYPVPDPNFPFLGVHFTRRINGDIDAGPNAVLAFKREGYQKSDINIKELLESITYKGFLKVALKYYKVGYYEMYRSLSKRSFLKSLQKLIPEIKMTDLVKGNSGVRAQLCDDQGNLIDDFKIMQKKNIIHVLNAPSPAATSSLNIGREISDRYFEIYRNDSH